VKTTFRVLCLHSSFVHVLPSHRLTPHDKRDDTVPGVFSSILSQLPGSVHMFRLGSDVLDKARNVTQKCVIVKICLFLEDGSESQKRYSLFNLSFRHFKFILLIHNYNKEAQIVSTNKIMFKVKDGSVKP
jgi:hypothetical protein